MAASSLSIIPAVALAYSDARRILRAMTMLAVFAVLIGLAIKVAEDLFPQRVWDGPVGTALSLALGAVESFCLTPIMIAFHRFIILDEVAPGYVVDPSRPGFMAFFGWLVALSILRELVFLTQETLTALGVPVLIAAVPTLVVLIVVIILSLRLIILFPAFAVNSRGANALNALADSEGHVFRIFMIFVLAGLPFAVLAIAVTIFLGRSVAVPGTPAAMVGLAVGAVIQTAILILFVAIASRLFQTLAARVAGKSEAKPL
ncbi:MAG: hypothetical protein WA322_18225 [Pseudolabrys sp.]